jgi:hypothetical protein
MPGRDEHASGHWAGGPERRLGGVALALNAIGRALEAESNRLSLWIPVLLGGGILAYFALAEEPRLLTAAALILAAAGLILTLSSAARRSLSPRASPMPSSTPRWPALRFSPRRCAG